MTLQQNPGVVVSQCGGFHGRFGAQAAHAAGLLQRFVTTFPRYAEMPPGKISDLHWLDLLPRATGRLNSVFHTSAFSFLNRLYRGPRFACYQMLCSRQINSDTRVFHAYSSYQEKCWLKCDRLGVRKLIDWGIAHPGYLHELLAEEGERLGVPYTRGNSVEEVLCELEQADVVYVPSDFVRRTFREAGYSGNNLRTNAYGVDLDLFVAGSHDTDRPFRIITGGALSLRKGTFYLLEAVKQLKRDGLPVELYLMGAPESAFAPILARYRDSITHVGAVPHHQLAEYLATASVFVLPSLAEGMSRMVFEAMACGLPCVVTPNTGHAQTVIDGENGFLVPIRDAEAIRKKIFALYLDRDRAVYMGQQARGTAEKNTWSGYMKRLASDYSEQSAQ